MVSWTGSSRQTEPLVEEDSIMAESAALIIF